MSPCAGSLIPSHANPLHSKDKSIHRSMAYSIRSKNSHLDPGRSSPLPLRSQPANLPDTAHAAEGAQSSSPHRNSVSHYAGRFRRDYCPSSDPLPNLASLFPISISFPADGTQYVILRQNRRTPRQTVLSRGRRDICRAQRLTQSRRDNLERRADRRHTTVFDGEGPGLMVQFDENGYIETLLRRHVQGAWRANAELKKREPGPADMSLLLTF